MPELRRLPEQKWNSFKVVDPFPQLPGANGCFLGPSAAGKTTTLLSLLTGPYKGAFAELHVFSPSVHLDSAWDQIKNEFAKSLEASSFHEEWDQNALTEILSKQKATVQGLKHAKSKKNIPQVLIIIDDFADAPEVLHKSGGLLTTLYTKGRHFFVSTWTSTQKLTTLSTVSRANFRFICCWRLRNQKEIDTLVEELSAVYPKKVLYDMYQTAINDQPYSFWFIDLTAKQRDDMFFIRFAKRMLVESKSSDDALPHKGKRSATELDDSGASDGADATHS